MFDALSDKISNVFRTVTGKANISEKNVEEAVERIKEALLEADVNLRVVRRFVTQTLEEAQGEKVLKAVNPSQQFIKIVHDKLTALLGEEQQELILKGPDVLTKYLFLGLQGSGKTTTVAKLALKLKKEKKRKILLVAADLVRPAAIEQLKVLAEQIQVDIYYNLEEKNPVKIVEEAMKHAHRNSYSIMIVDTAGRQQVNEELMKELHRVKKAFNPDESILVADAMTGQVAVEVAKTFNDEIGITSVIFSKFDSDTRGGAALSLKTITKAPIKFIGTGEKLEDLDAFYPERMADRILGMGDIVSLVEKAQENMNEEDAFKMQEKIMNASFTLEDYLEQFQQIKKMGPLEKVAKMIPGVSSAMIEQGMDHNRIKQEEAIILSMTKAERRNHKTLSNSRKIRIAKGSGTSVAQINTLIKRFETMRTSMKKLMTNKNLQKQMMQMLGGSGGMEGLGSLFGGKK